MWSGKRAEASVPAIRRLTSLAILVVGLFSSFIILCWLSGHAALRAFAGHSMKPNTALGLLWCAGALWLLRHESPLPPWRRVAGRILAGLAGLLGLFTFLEYAGGLELNIDQLWVTDIASEESRRYPGRMAPNAAVGFFLLGSALVLLDWRKARRLWPAQLLLLGAVLLSLLALIGYAYGVVSLYQVEGWIRITPYTAASMLLLSVGTLCARPHDGVARVFTGTAPASRFSRRLLLAASVVPVLLGWLELVGQRAGLYGDLAGLALLVSANVVILSLLVWGAGRQLLAVDRSRQEAEASLRASEQRSRFLAEASKVLASSLDYEVSLREVARLACASLADWCVVDVIERDGSLRRVAVAHADPARAELAADVAALEIDPEKPGLFMEALGAGGSVLREEPRGEDPRRREQSPVLQLLGAHASLTVLMRARERTVGAITLISTESGRRYGPTELEVAEELSRRAALSVDNARLYRKAQAERERLLSLFMQAPTPIILRRGPLHIHELVNTASEQLLGEAMPGVDPGTIEVLDRVYATGERFVGREERWEQRLPDGTLRERFFDLVHEPLRDEEGRVEGVMTLLHEVTDQLLARRNVERQREWLEAVLDRMPMPLVLVEPATAEVTFVNAAADRQTFGYPRRLPPDEQERYYATDAQGQRIPASEMARHRVARGERLDGVEMTWHTPDSSVPLLVFGDMLPALYGHPATGIILFQDVSRLKDKERRLEQAVQARDEFLSIASHELKTPLSAMMLQLQMLRRRVKPEGGQVPPLEKLSSGLDTALRQIDRITVLVEDLLDVSRIQAGRLSLTVEEVELAGLVRDVGVQLSEQLAKAHNPLELDLEEGLVGWWDHARLEQILINLLTNAMKYAPGGPVRVTLRREGEGVRLAVKDSGPGIPKERQERIFERFERAEAARSITGLGLGLFIVKQLVEGHGGSIHVESEEGRGATFVVELPLARRREPVEQAAAGE